MGSEMCIRDRPQEEWSGTGWDWSNQWEESSWQDGYGEAEQGGLPEGTGGTMSSLEAGLGYRTGGAGPGYQTGQRLDQVELNAMSDYKWKDPSGTEWVKLTYDTGAASCALPLAMDPGNIALEKKGSFVVANGDPIDHYQRFRVPAWDQ